MADIGLYKRTKKLIADNAWWVTIVSSVIVGLICLAASFANLYSESHRFAQLVPPRNLSELLKSIGTAVLSGGVFAAVLKALQFSGVFKEELTSIIYSNDYLEHRTDIEDIWKKVSRVLYKRKFEEISEELEKTILETYFPTNINFYYSNFKEDIHIGFHDPEKKYIRSEETMSFTVHPIDSAEKCDLPYEVGFVKNSNYPLTDYQLLALKIEGQIVPVTVEDKSTDKELIKRFEFSLMGREKYRVTIKHTKIFSPEIDNTKSYSAGRFVMNFDLRVDYPAELEMQFYSMGTAKEFVNIDSPGRSLKQVYSGLIFPNQGYRLVMSRMIPEQTVEPRMEKEEH